MPRPRKSLVCVTDTPYYHVTSRCVRRAFLCGFDQSTGKSFEHRKQWVEDRARILASLFSVELCAYAIMSNHYHLVVRLNPDEALAWSDDEVLARWTSLFKGPLLVRRYRNGEKLRAAELDSMSSMTAVFRRRLASLSWFMKCLNEPIARMANREDGCTGHFWEARFFSQALRSERALIASMAYVDLNPVRAGIAARPELSEHTSLRVRRDKGWQNKRLLKAVSDAVSRKELIHFNQPLRPLMPFSRRTQQARAPVLPIRESDYIKLIETTLRYANVTRNRQQDSVPSAVLSCLGLSVDQWVKSSTDFEKHYRSGDLKKTA